MQQINTILNEKIESQSKMLAITREPLKQVYSSSTQTPSIDDANNNNSIDRNLLLSTASISTQTDLKLSPKTTSPSCAMAKKTVPANNSKEETHLLATLRGMRVDLAIKEKAMQRLTRELDECKKTMKKLQKERDGETK